MVTFLKLQSRGGFSAGRSLLMKAAAANKGTMMEMLKRHEAEETKKEANLDKIKAENGLSGVSVGDYVLYDKEKYRVLQFFPGTVLISPTQAPKSENAEVSGQQVDDNKRSFQVKFGDVKPCPRQISVVPNSAGSDDLMSPLSPETP